jgi:signal transduction histidine kinase
MLRRSRGAGLTYRMALAGGVMAVFAIGTLALCLLATAGLRDTVSDANRARAVLVSAHRLENVVTDLETDSRVFVLIGDQRFFRSYGIARAAFDGRAADFERASANDDASQGRQAYQIVGAGKSYLHDYSVPLMTTARNDHAAAWASVTSGEGLKRLAEFRDRFARFVDAQRKIATAREHRSVAAAYEAHTAALVVATGPLGLICLFIIYLTRVVVRPVRRVSAMAGELAEGDLAVRMPETSPGEIGRLENSFNTMAVSLETSRDKLCLVAEEQRALRRIATLIARGVQPDDLFTAVATETGRLLSADHATIFRYEPDNTVTVVGYWSDPRARQVMPPLDGHWPVEDGTVTAAVLNSGRPARMTNYEDATSAIGVWARSNGICCVVGCPVTVGGRVWGALVAPDGPPGTEDRICQLVELISTAIANAQSHSDLLASRARVVTAADESRQRIERRLHDGTQQRLVSATLRLRIAQASVTPGQEELDQLLSAAVEDLSQALEELQEISRGIAPSSLRTKGLPSALRSLARRSTVPVELDVRIDRRLPEPIEAAVYYTVSEALTNVTKHARATTVDVHIRVQDTVRLSIEDDGVGGADLRRGTGLVGLKDRVEALDGRLDIVSPTGHGTALLADIPIGGGAGLGVRAERRGIRPGADS